MRGLWVAALCVSCATTRQDSVPGGDSRLDEDTRGDAEVKKAVAEGRCGPDDRGDLVLLDARTGGPLTCTAATVSMAPDACPSDTECATEVLVRGVTNRRGELVSPRKFSHVRLEAVSEGYGTGTLAGASLATDRLLEIEMPPDDGFWLKVLDGDGNYVQDVLVTFKAGNEVLAELRSNVLANVFFAQRNPFSGQEVTVEADGYRRSKISGQGDLGDDGHTLTLLR